MVVQQRAISNEQKQKRRQEILDAALRLFEKSDYASISIQRISEEAGMAKGTVFLYFKTKEELFLALTEQTLEKWLSEIRDELERGLQQGENLSIEEIVRILDSSLQNNPVAIRLLSILDSTLERNVDYDTAFRFKAFFRERILQAGSQFEKSLPFLNAGEGLMVFVFLYVSIIGAYHAANPAPVVQEVLKQPGMDLFQLNFRETLSAMTVVLLNGIKHQPGRDPGKGE